MDTSVVGTSRLTDLENGEIMLGMDDDGEPVVLTMVGKKKGGLLFIGDRKSGKTRAVLGILTYPGNIDNVIPVVLTDNIEAYKPLLSVNPRAIVSSSNSAIDQVYSLFKQRRKVRSSGAKTILLVLDQLDLAGEKDMPKVLDMLDEGPNHGVWVIATKTDDGFEDESDNFTYFFIASETPGKFMVETEPPVDEFNLYSLI